MQISALAMTAYAPALLRPLAARPFLRAAPPAASLLLADDAPLSADDALAAASAAVDTITAALPTELPEAGVVTDTLLDIGVYGLIALTVLLTGYSIYVTLKTSDEQYGGWTKRDDQENDAFVDDDNFEAGSRLRAGAKYDPATDTWTYEKKEEGPRVGRPSQGAAATKEEEGNRYDRRMEKKRKKAKARGRGGKSR